MRHDRTIAQHDEVEVGEHAGRLVIGRPGLVVHCVITAQCQRKAFHQLDIELCEQRERIVVKREATRFDRAGGEELADELRRIAGLEISEKTFSLRKRLPQQLGGQHIGKGPEITAIGNLLILAHALVEVEQTRQRGDRTELAGCAEFLRERFQLLLIVAFEQRRRGEVDILREIALRLPVGSD